jgi:hypothetical protein
MTQELSLYHQRRIRTRMNPTVQCRALNFDEDRSRSRVRAGDLREHASRLQWPPTTRSTSEWSSPTATRPRAPSQPAESPHLSARAGCERSPAILHPDGQRHRGTSSSCQPQRYREGRAANPVCQGPSRLGCRAASRRSRLAGAHVLPSSGKYPRAATHRWQIPSTTRHLSPCRSSHGSRIQRSPPTTRDR